MTSTQVDEDAQHFYEQPLNSIILFDKRGVPKLHYSKVHICAFDNEKVLSPGADFCVTDLDIGRGTIKLGSMICFDREFPESARILMLKGAEVIFLAEIDMDMLLDYREHEVMGSIIGIRINMEF